MALTHQGVNTAGDGTGTTLAITRPTTTTDDLFFLDFYIEAAGALTSLNFTNGTWVLVASQVQVGTSPDFTHFRYRSKYAGEGAACTVSWTGSTEWRTAVITAYRGQDLTTPEDAAATKAASASSSASAVAPGLTTVTNDALIHYSEADYDSRTVTPPTGTTPTFTERTDFAAFSVGDGILASAGATGDKTATLASASWNTSGLVALRPAGGAAAQQPRAWVPNLGALLARG